MKQLIDKAKKMFPHTPILVREVCSVDGNNCRKCYEECTLRYSAVFTTAKSKCIGWFEDGGFLQKTNPKPSKKYLKRVLGINPQKKKRRRKFYGGNRPQGSRSSYEKIV